VQMANMVWCPTSGLAALLIALAALIVGGTPTWGGASAREGLDLLHALAGIDFVAFDVNTVSPPHDVAGMTAFLAGTVLLECLTLACFRPGGPAAGAGARGPGTVAPANEGGSSG